MAKPQAGFIHAVVLLVLIAGLVLGVFTVGRTVFFKPHASVGEVENSLSLVGTIKTDYSKLPVTNPELEVGYSQTFNVDLLVKATDPVNLIKTQLSYPKDLLEAVELKKDNTVVKNWVEEKIDNNQGMISLTGGIPNPGFSSPVNQAGFFLRIVFKVKPGVSGKDAKIDLLESSSKIYRNDTNLPLDQVVKRSLLVKISSQDFVLTDLFKSKTAETGEQSATVGDEQVLGKLSQVLSKFPGKDGKAPAGWEAADINQDSYINSFDVSLLIKELGKARTTTKSINPSSNPSAIPTTVPTTTQSTSQPTASTVVEERDRCFDDGDCAPSTACKQLTSSSGKSYKACVITAK